MTKEQLLHEALSLDPCQRDELAEQLWQSINDGELPPEKIEEIRGRIQAMERGEGSSKLSDEVVARLRKKHSQ